jgi:hypothetical protein
MFSVINHLDRLHNMILRNVPNEELVKEVEKYNKFSIEQLKKVIKQYKTTDLDDDQRDIMERIMKETKI